LVYLTTLLQLYKIYVVRWYADSE